MNNEFWRKHRCMEKKNCTKDCPHLKECKKLLGLGETWKFPKWIKVPVPIKMVELGLVPKKNGKFKKNVWKLYE